MRYYADFEITTAMIPAPAGFIVYGAVAEKNENGEWVTEGQTYPPIAIIAKNKIQFSNGGSYKDKREHRQFTVRELLDLVVRDFASEFDVLFAPFPDENLMTISEASCSNSDYALIPAGDTKRQEQIMQAALEKAKASDLERERKISEQQQGKTVSPSLML